ncbi:MAG: hypothetical protein OJF55_002309 [Rhodanobacteraceae bacterium]|jgi:hypothetical protein|nr:MAG: hypothetical protein OJF55_002309 [Rhodanobacteraceae bacterium]
MRGDAQLHVLRAVDSDIPGHSRLHAYLAIQFIAGSCRIASPAGEPIVR